MADPTEGGTDVLYLGPLAPPLVALIAGLVIHSFIIGVNVSDWWRGRSVTPVDHIVTSLGITRICTQSSDMLYMLMVSLSLDAQVPLVIMDVAYNFFTNADICFTTLLSIVYCLKISNLHTRLFLYLRRMISHRTGRLIVASILFCASNSLMTLLLFFLKVTNNGPHNTTTDDVSPDCICSKCIYNIATGTFLPLFFYSISSVLLFVSLYHHTTRMKMSSNVSINLETYYSAMRSVSFTFIYNTVYFIAHFISVLYLYFYCMELSWLYKIISFLPALHSSYLIYRTAKLRNEMFKVLQNFMNYLLQRTNAQNSET
ncbi:hypothetical protein GDO81_025063 [Engystomops pustulosus]|uniref:Taste receptor type 2 n=1 Tax=Engystomops pustulosus TaxID=76066 RepID=A0AAV6ZGS8_ENGPU|nr:hypothetical protein GDO81_025063 [Engystomops pustulosus]